jgi:hypothetical protein
MLETFVLLPGLQLQSSLALQAEINMPCQER